LISRFMPDDDSGETAHYDDATIGRAFRWSLAVFGLLAAAGMVGWLAFRPRAAPPAPPSSAVGAALAAGGVRSKCPPSLYRYHRGGRHCFVHANGAVGEKLLPETMGGGVAFLDFDNDGNPDLLFINGTRGRGPAPGRILATAALYRNLGGGKFTTSPPVPGWTSPSMAWEWPWATTTTTVGWTS
jgi:enediyne biosynthesis protein E4